jgi:hypothetical protein
MLTPSKEFTMLTMRDHGVQDYAVLPDMDGTDVGVLNDDDRACLAELGQYLATTDAWNRFGIWLLHKHFEPSEGEVFVEQLADSPRGTRTAPIARSADLNATAIRFDGSVDGVAAIGMEFAAPADFGDTAPFSEEDEAILAGLAERLDASGKLDRFGVRLIRNPLGLSDSEMLHETSDSSDRTLNCVVSDRAAFLAQDTIETTWRWRVVEGESQPTVMQDCTVGCVRVGEGHDISHAHSEDFGGND